MRRLLSLLLFIYVACPSQSRAQEVLIVADEFHAMQVLAAQIEADTRLKTTIMGQTEIPASLASYRAVMVYLHGELQAGAEHKFIQYANEGGNLVLLHHSISSRKRENKDWFNFLHIELPNRPLAEGGYAYFDPVGFEVVNLAPGNAITTRGVKFDHTIPYASPEGAVEKKLPGTSFQETEVYVNHVLSGPRIVLLGVKYTDPKTGKVFMQDTAGWLLPTGKGDVFYFMMGHRTEDFEDAAYRRILDNAVEYRR
ncbi:ThuA domain-containing protein [Edaphobacter modestus]|nr:ThuA domain-containing protein [Edaphobacter modestus]